jgi:hypothetical protein
MALTIETGARVTGANSYVSLVDAQAWADAREIDVEVTEALLLKAMDYLESLRAEYQGVKVSATQALQWPRYGVELDGYPLDSDDIPSTLISAQCQLACDASTLELMPSGDGREVVEESMVMGLVAKKYSPGSGGTARPHLRAAEAFLAPLLNSAVGAGFLTTVRV